MTDRYSSTTTTKKKKKKNNNDDDLSDFGAFCSLILSHPLYFSYLILFSPYLFKLLSFLSPLFITTSLLFLSLLTNFIHLRSITNSKEGFLFAVYNTLVERLRPGLDDGAEELQPIEEFEVYKIVFETPIIELMEENPDEKDILEEKPVGFSEKKAPPEEAKAENQSERLKMKYETGDVKNSKVKEEANIYESILTKNRSESKEVSINKDLKPKGGSLRLDHEKKLSEAFYQTVGSPHYSESVGSMRKEREWRRTLAFKLFEERNNGSYGSMNGSDNGEGMDLLWETYESESNRGKTGEKNRKGRREKNDGLMVVKDEEDEHFGEEEDEDDNNGKICCLQALKLSAGKMNLSMGRSSLIKFGRAFKGMGWLQSHAKGRGKKGTKKYF